jgi:hypothetical protein
MSISNCTFYVIARGVSPEAISEGWNEIATLRSQWQRGWNYSRGRANKIFILRGANIIGMIDSEPKAKNLWVL